MFPENTNPCPSTECWTWTNNRCDLKDGCTAIECGATAISIKFKKGLFGADYGVNNILPAPSGPEQITMGTDNYEGYTLECGLGGCEMDYTITENKYVLFDLCFYFLTF